MRIINSPRWGGGAIEPVQNLSSLGYDSGGTPTHFVDSVNGYNANIIKGVNYIGDGVSYFDNNTAPTTPATVTAFEISFWYKHGTVASSIRFSLDTGFYKGQGFLMYDTSSSNDIIIALKGTSGSTLSMPVDQTTHGDISNHYRFRWESGTVSKYINGVLNETGSLDTPFLPLCFVSGARRNPNIGQAGVGDYEISDVRQVCNDSETIAHHTFCESIVNASSHICYDISGQGNHATFYLNSGNGTDSVKAHEGDYAQAGYLDDTVNQIVPILEDGTAFADGTALTDTDAVLNDGTKWLRNGTELIQDTTESILVTADSQELWYTSGVANEVTDSNLVLFAASYPTIYGATYDTDFIKNITLTQV